MLTPEFLESIEFNNVVQLYNRLNINITEDIIRKILSMEDISSTSRQQLKILMELNGKDVFENALEQTAIITAERKKELKALCEEMIKEDLQGYKELFSYRGMPFKLNNKQYQILNQGLRQTDKTLRNLTNTIAFQAKQIYVNVVDEAYMNTISGAFDYNSAINSAVHKLANNGVTLKDKLGRNVQLEVAVRRNVLSGIRDVAHNINKDVEESLGCNGKEVTAHRGARPSHAEAQGKQYAYSKSDAKKFSVGYWGDVEDLWKEYNCHHDCNGIILGISKPQYTEKELEDMKNAIVTLNGKEVPLYEATQKQRQLENNIRKIKRSIAILEKSGQDTTDEKIRLTAYNKRLNSFCQETGLVKDYARIKIAKI